MDRNQILHATFDACVDLLEADRGDLSEDTRFGDDLDADSLDVVEVMMALEDRFGITIPEDDLEDVETIGQAVDRVQNRLGDEPNA
jgi:acyl carrier protein